MPVHIPMKNEAGPVIIIIIIIIIMLLNLEVVKIQTRGIYWVLNVSVIFYTKGIIVLSLLVDTNFSDKNYFLYYLNIHYIISQKYYISNLFLSIISNTPSPITV
jgi:hypothetical protein